MEQFALIIAPVIWQKLPLLGTAFILEFLQSKDIQCYLFDMNIDIYNKVKKNKLVKYNWTKNYKNFTNEFYKSIMFQHKEYFSNIITFLKNHKVKYIGFSIYKTNFLFSYNFAREIKTKIPKAKIIFGGPHITALNCYNPQYLNDRLVDHFIIGEGEQSVLEVIQNKINNKVVHPSPIKNPEKIFFPQYKLFNLKLYDRKNSLPILSSKGCINQCSFCFEKKLFKTYTIRQPEHIIEEIKFHIKNNKIHWFTFYDSIFNGNLQHIEKLLMLLEKQKINLNWDAQISIRNDMDNSLLKLMKKTGCINLFIGMETGSQFILQQMNKNINIKDIELFLKKLSNYDLNFEISLIVNYPFENTENFNQLINFILKNKKHIKKIAQINPYIYYHGTKTDITNGYNFIKGLQKVNELTQILSKESIKYTNAYINNLII